MLEYGPIAEANVLWLAGERLARRLGLLLSDWGSLVFTAIQVGAVQPVAHDGCS